MHCPHCHQLVERSGKGANAAYTCAGCGRVWRPAAAPGAQPQNAAAFDALASPAAMSESTVTLKWRSRPKRIINPKLAAIAAAACVVLLLAAWGVRKISNRISHLWRSQPAAADAAPEGETLKSTWLPDPAIARWLGDETGISQHRFRVPREFSPFPRWQQPVWLPPHATLLCESWIRMPDRQALIVASEVKYATAEEHGGTLEAAFERFCDRMQRSVRAATFSTTEPESGYLDGKPFIKARFSGRIKFAQDLPRVDRAGQVLIGLDGATEFTLYFLCDADGSEELFRQLETSLLTLRTSEQALPLP